MYTSGLGPPWEALHWSGTLVGFPDLPDHGTLSSETPHNSQKGLGIPWRWFGNRGISWRQHTQR